jgi:hypothetical protein
LFDAEGHAVTAAELLFGSNGHAAVTVSDLGAVTAGELLEGHGTSVTLHGGDVISSEINLTDNSVLNVDQSSNGTGLTLNGTSTRDLTIDPSSMDLIFTLLPPSASPDWDFRWEDPNSTKSDPNPSWISTLTTLITGGQITLTLQPGESYKIVNSGSYTYIDGVPGPVSSVPLPSPLMLSGLGLAGLGAARMKRWWVGVGTRPM